MSSYSYCKDFGKDKVMFVTKEDHATPSTIELPPPEPQPSLIANDGSINWSCPCLGGMATGPCGVEFRDAFSCFHYSEAEPKGSDCFEAFRKMQDCFQLYPTVYNKTSSGDDDDEDGGLDIAGLEGLKDEVNDVTDGKLIDERAGDSVRSAGAATKHSLVNGSGNNSAVSPTVAVEKKKQ